jgi:hypothetical protein
LSIYAVSVSGIFFAICINAVTATKLNFLDAVITEVFELFKTEIGVSILDLKKSTFLVFTTITSRHRQENTFVLRRSPVFSKRRRAMGPGPFDAEKFADSEYAKKNFLTKWRLQQFRFLPSILLF